MLAVKKRPPKQPVYEILHRQASVQEQRRQQRIAEKRAAEMQVRCYVTLAQRAEPRLLLRPRCSSQCCIITSSSVA